MHQEPDWIFDKEASHGPIEVLRTFQELKNIRTLLKEENEKFKKQIKAITGELEVIHIENDEAEEAYAKYKNKTEFLFAEIEMLKDVRNRLTEEINQLRLQLKAATSDRDSSALALETMNQELEDILGEKSIILNRLKSVAEGINRICQERESSVPDIKGHDQILRRVYRVFKEAGDRMDVSIQFSGSDTE